MEQVVPSYFLIFMTAHFKEPAGIGFQTALRLVPAFREALTAWHTVDTVDVVGSTHGQVRMIAWPVHQDADTFAKLGQDMQDLSDRLNLPFQVLHDGKPVPVRKLAF